MFPQANDFEKVLTVVHAVAAQTDKSTAIADTIGVSAKREGSFYADAADHLGLLDTDTTGGLRTHQLTEVGEHIYSVDIAERAELCRQVVTHIAAVAEYVDGGADTLRRPEVV